MNYTRKQISGAFDPIKMIMYALFVFRALFLLFGSSFGPYDEHYVFIIVIVVVLFLTTYYDLGTLQFPSYDDSLGPVINE